MSSYNSSPENTYNSSEQRKTTLKWTNDGDLSSLDMARILDKLENEKLTKCDITCDLEK